MADKSAPIFPEATKVVTGCFDRLSAPLHRASLSRAFGFWATVSVVVLVLLAAEVLLAYRAADELSERNARTLAFTTELRARADRELNAVLYLSSGLAAYFSVRHDAIDPPEIEALLGEVFKQGAHLRNIAVAIGYQVEFVYPRPGNERVIGQDYRKIPEQWPMVKSAIERRSGVLTGPVTLIQGGKALIYRVPIFVGDQYWGLLSTVIDMNAFNSAAFKGVGGDHFEFSIRSEETSATSGGLLWGKSELFDDPALLRLQSSVPGGSWVYVVRNLEHREARLHWLLRALAGLTALIAGLAVYTVLGQRRALAHQAGIDSLTDLPNRRLFDDRLEQSLRRHAREAGGTVTVIFLDLNGFKRLNDSYGHRFGDAILRVVARRLREEVRLADTVARWAGDEYALIVDDANAEEIEQLIKRLRSIIAAPFRANGVPVTVTSSFGAATYPSEAVSAESLLELADQRMYADKQRQAETPSAAS